MPTDVIDARRAYELGRLRSSAWRAGLVVALVAGIGALSAGRLSLSLLPLTFASWLFVHWRGRALLVGARYGLAAGVVTALLPMSLLRPCCTPEMLAGGLSSSAACCTMPGACLAAGGAVGALVAALVPLKAASWWRSAIGVALGTGSVVVLECATLAAGEAVGLVGGLLAGLAAAAAARRLLTSAA